MIRNVLAVWLLLATAAMAQMTPKAVIVGQKETISGDMVSLDASQSQGTKFKWRLCLEPGQADKAFFGKDTDMQIGFSAGVRKETRYRFMLAVAAANSSGGVDIDIAFHDVVVKPLYPCPEDPTVPVVPPVNPTTDPVKPVVQTLTRALILHENDEDTQLFQKLVQHLRVNKDVGKLLLVLDKNGRNYDETLNKIVQAATQYVNGAALPRIIAVDSLGGFAKHAEMPKTEDDLDKLMKEWGLMR
jgi:hypothetical protein